MNCIGQNHGKQKWKRKWGECTTGTYEIYDKRVGYHRPFSQCCGPGVPATRKLATHSSAGGRRHCAAAADASGSTRYSTACYPSNCSWGGELWAPWSLLEKMDGLKECHMWWCAGLVHSGPLGCHVGGGVFIWHGQGCSNRRILRKQNKI